MGQAVLVFGIGIGDVGFGFLEFGLAELDDGAKTEIVARLREVKGKGSLFAELLGDGEALESAIGILPRVSNVAGNVVAEVG